MSGGSVGGRARAKVIDPITQKPTEEKKDGAMVIGLDKQGRQWIKVSKHQHKSQLFLTNSVFSLK